MLGRYRFTRFSIGNIPVLFALLVFVFCATSQTLEAQAFRETTATGDTPAEARRPQDSLIVGVNLDAVSILVTARNTKGDYISSLKANDFQVLEDGDEQPISFFKQDTVPVNVVFLVDASYSVNDVLPNIIDAAVTFAGHLRKDDKYAAVIFAHKPIKVLDWTTDLPSMQNILKNIKTFGKTALYDSMEFVIENMFDKVQGKRWRGQFQQQIASASDEAGS